MTKTGTSKYVSESTTAMNTQVSDHLQLTYDMIDVNNAKEKKRAQESKKKLNQEKYLATKWDFRFSRRTNYMNIRYLRTRRVNLDTPNGQGREEEEGEREWKIWEKIVKLSTK